MNQPEKDAFNNLTSTVKRLEQSHHDLGVENGKLKAELEALRAQIVAPPTDTTDAEVVAAANALAAEVDAELTAV